MTERAPAGAIGRGPRRIGVLGWVLRGAAAGAAGTTALNAGTYLDMAIRGRAASSTPERSVGQLAETAHIDLGTGGQRENRLQGLGPLTGLAVGTGMGAVVGLLRAAGLRFRPVPGTALITAGAMVAANGPMVLMGITDPRSWSAADWLGDAVPHLAYGVVVSTTVEAFIQAKDPLPQCQPRGSTPPGTGAAGSYGVRVNTKVPRFRWSSAIRSTSPA